MNAPALNVPSVEQMFNVSEDSPHYEVAFVIGVAFIQNANFT